MSDSSEDKIYKSLCSIELINSCWLDEIFFSYFLISLSVFKFVFFMLSKIFNDILLVSFNIWFYNFSFNIMLLLNFLLFLKANGKKFFNLFNRNLYWELSIFERSYVLFFFFTIENFKLLFWKYGLAIIEMEGTSIINVVPSFILLSTFMFPPNFSIIYLQMLRPKPVPVGLFFLCSSNA